MPSSTDSATTAANSVPTFSPSTSTRTVAENTASGTNLGGLVTASDSDTGDTLTYSLRGTDGGSFAVVASSGQLRTSGALDHESKASYSVTVRVDDGDGGTADASVTISVTDVDEPPRRPAAPSVGAVSGSTTSLDVSWSAPENAGRPAIASYDVQYRKHGRDELDERSAERHGDVGAALQSRCGHGLQRAGAGVERRGRQPVFAVRLGQHECGGQRRAGVQPEFGDVDAGGRTRSAS